MSRRSRPVMSADELMKMVMNPSVEVPKQKPVVVDSDEDDKKDVKPSIKLLDLDYSKKFRDKELERLASASANLNPMTRRFASSVENYEDEMQFAIDSEIESLEAPELSALDRYQFDIPPPDLPIKEYRDEILRLISENMFVIIKATTGIGKSTQVPQYILEDAHRNKRNCNIVITQPRIIAGKLNY